MVTVAHEDRNFGVMRIVRAMLRCTASLTAERISAGVRAMLESAPVAMSMRCYISVDCSLKGKGGKLNFL